MKGYFDLVDYGRNNNSH
jgi:hypothetical protein